MHSDPKDCPPEPAPPVAETAALLAETVQLKAVASELLRRMPAGGVVTAPPVVDVVLPVYNEASLIEQTFASVERFAQQHPDYRFRFVDDGSADATGPILRRLMERACAGGDVDPARVAVTHHRRNRGKAHAVRTGLRRARGDRFIYMDGDLAYSLDHLPLVVAALGGADVAIGSRRLVGKTDGHTRLRRQAMGWTFNKTARVLFNLPYRDTQAGIKGFRIDAARAIFGRQRIRGFSFDVEVLVIARMLGYRIVEIAARVAPTHRDKPSSVKLIRQPAKMLGELLRIKFNSARAKYD